MSDRNKMLAGIFVLALLGLVLWIWFAPPSPETVQPLSPQPSPVESKATLPSSIPPIITTPVQMQEAKRLYEERVRIREESVKDTRLQFRTPIVFYGKVIDEKDQPVVGAEVKYGSNSIDPTLTKEVTYEGKVYSDNTGMFKIDDIKGVAVGFEITHPDYYASVKNRTLAGYAMGRDPNVPDTAEKAWVFRMYKKKEPIALISGSNGIKVPVNGTLGTIRLGAQGQMQVEAWASPPSQYTGKPFDWRVRLSIPGGGIIESNEEFNFEAPQNGYQSSIEINMPSGKDGWTESVRKTYILNLGGTYARMNTYVNSGKQIFVSVNYLINPTPGSRNLEYDPTKQIKPY
jgi:hypothetical protein